YSKIYLDIKFAGCFYVGNIVNLKASDITTFLLICHDYWKHMSTVMLILLDLLY
ncbi:unnamed protein product, partial [Cylicocyclus nassatus]